jgi:hypothetical protein
MSSSIKLRCLDDSGNNIFLVDSTTGIYSKNTNESTNSSTGGLLLYGGLSINKTSNSSSITQGGALTIAGGASFEKDVHIGGNLTVYGTQTQIISQTVNVQDNLIVINSSPIVGRDAGILFQRYQLENDTGLGDIVKDSPVLSSVLSSSTSTTVTLNVIASSQDDYYTGAFIKITSGSGNGQVRRITNYIGISRILTVNTAWTIQPSINDTFAIYNRVYATQYYNETQGNFTLGWTSDDPGSTNVVVSDYIGMKMGYVNIFNTVESIGIGSGGSFTTLGGASIEKSLYVGINANIGTNVSIGSNLVVPNIKATSTTVSNLLSSNATLTNVTSNNVNIIDNLVAVGNSNTIGNIYTTGGNVGINTTTPGNKLDVNGSANIDGVFTISDGLRFIKSSNINRIESGISVTTSNSTADLSFTSISGASVYMTIASSGNIGITRTNPEYNLDVNGSVRCSGGILAINESNTLGNLFTYSGNIGINIKNPTYKLDVNGSAHIKTNLYVDGLISGGSETGSTFAYLTLTSTDDSINLSTGSLVTYGGITVQSPTDAVSITNGGGMLIEGGAAIGKRLFVGNGIVSDFNSNTIGSIFTTGGNVGINTTSPMYVLDLGKSNNTQILSLSSDTDSFNGFGFTSGNVIVYQATGSHSFKTGSSRDNVGTEQLTINSTGVGIGTNNPVYKLDVSGTIRGDSLIVGGLGTYTYGSIYRDSDWGMLFRSGTNNPNSAHFAWADYNDNKLMCISSTGGNVGIATTTPRFKLDVNGSMYVESSTRVANANVTGVSGGCLNINGDTVLSGTSGIYFTQTGSGINPPTMTTRSLGSKIVLYPSLSSVSADYALGIETSNMWSSVPDSTSGFVWYQGSTRVMSLQTGGNLVLHSTENSSGVGTGGSFVALGGGSVVKDLYIGGSLVVNGQNLTSIVGNTIIGSFTGTGVCEITGISIGKTMSNTNYKIIGNLQTTSNNTNIYTVSFKNLTTTTFDVVIYRIDSLGSGWTDINLKLSWQLTP